MEQELTSAEVFAWFERAYPSGVNIFYTVDGKNIAAADVIAYVRKIEQRMVKLAAKLADQT